MLSDRELYNVIGGATVFSALGYLYIVNRNRYSFAGVFLTKKKE